LQKVDLSKVDKNLLRGAAFVALMADAHFLWIFTSGQFPELPLAQWFHPVPRPDETRGNYSKE
jgi:hypothetical protein